jgi:predicted protein tyrosine phosphatase
VRQVILAPLFAIEGPWQGRLAIAPAPVPGPYLERNLQHWKKLGVQGVVSLMVAGERPGWEREAEISRIIGLKFSSIPIEDHTAPPPEQLREIESKLVAIETRLREGETIVVHCFAGIGRSGMACIALLMTGGVPLEKATTLVSQARGLPTPEVEAQQEWLRAFDRHRRLSYT